ncbi:Apoptosis-inducing factor 1, mitochondrial [Porphyridium purpureum]|uniref:Apoptosis-inducing factor 1, mitochondrial n=1 Tax=Porphyridium purpureum TaxID=35688 RepID=A0A5J4YX15_PORPP|nr:Apoptosis-inducing factor 1, mitochondrial [Porphyridium purpureum]|eukprot:POR7962..scf209_3
MQCVLELPVKLACECMWVGREEEVEQRRLRWMRASLMRDWMRSLGALRRAALSDARDGARYSVASTVRRVVRRSMSKRASLPSAAAHSTARMCGQRFRRQSGRAGWGAMVVGAGLSAAGLAGAYVYVSAPTGQSERVELVRHAQSESARKYMNLWRQFRAAVCDSGSLNLSTSEKSSRADQPIATHSVNPTEIFDFVICGAGTSAQAALEELHRISPNSSVLLLADEWREPYYDSPVCQSSLKEHAAADGQRGHDQLARLEKLCDNIRLGEHVDAVNVRQNCIHLSNGNVIGYKKLLLCLGASVDYQLRTKSMVAEQAGADRRFLAGRHHAGESELVKLIEQKSSSGQQLHVTVVGGGWNGTAYAAKLAGLGCAVTLMCSEPSLWHKYLPAYLIEFLTKQFKQLGIEVVPYASVQYVTPQTSAGRSDELVVHFGLTYDLYSSEWLRTDFVAFLPTHMPSPVLQLDSDGFLERNTQLGCIDANAELCVASDVYGAGDCVSYPSSRLGGRRRSTAHEHAIHSGKHAARNMLGVDKGGTREPYDFEPVREIDYSIVGSYMYCVGRCSSDCESYGYYYPSRSTDTELNGCVFYVEHKTLRVVGAMLLTEQACPSARETLRDVFTNLGAGPFFQEARDMHQFLTECTRKIMHETGIVHSDDGSTRSRATPLIRKRSVPRDSQRGDNGVDRL